MMPKMGGGGERLSTLTIVRRRVELYGEMGKGEPYSPKEGKFWFHKALAKEGHL